MSTNKQTMLMEVAMDRIHEGILKANPSTNTRIISGVNAKRVNTKNAKLLKYKILFTMKSV